MEELIDELLKELTKNEKIPEVYEKLLKLRKVDVQSKERIQEFIDSLSNVED